MNGLALAKAIPKVLREQAVRQANKHESSHGWAFIEPARTGTPVSTAL